jgi:Cu+-exporting ATPase
VDESLITGESVPVDRKPGDEVVGATMNLNGALTIEATQIGESTALAQMIALVEQAQAGKTRMQRLADKVSSVFIPCVIVVALLTLAGWWIASGFGVGVLTAIAVLVVACPCAMGLATPTAILVGSGIGARQGILIKEPAALERVGDLGVIVFDKTGTLTEGKPRVEAVEVFGGANRGGESIDENWILRHAAALEVNSGHPLAEAIVAAARERNLETGGVGEFNSLAGFGVEGRLAGERLRVGSPAWLEHEGIALDDAAARQVRSQEEQGRTTVILARAMDGGAWQPLGLVALADAVKPHSRAAVEALRKGGLAVWMITGDHPATARAVARQVGIDPANVMAGVRPDGKADKIAALQRETGHAVAMVGDGVNDAPALATADLGIAMASGADLAREAGDLTLVTADLMAVVRAIRLSRAMVRKIKQNLFWAFVYNTVLIPLAAFGVLPILAGATAMALSDACVIGNALLLKRVKLDKA